MPPLYKTKLKNDIVFYRVSAMKQLFAACGRETGKYLYTYASKTVSRMNI